MRHPGPCEPARLCHASKVRRFERQVHGIEGTEFSEFDAEHAAATARDLQAIGEFAIGGEGQAVDGPGSQQHDCRDAVNDGRVDHVDGEARVCGRITLESLAMNPLEGHPHVGGDLVKSAHADSMNLRPAVAVRDEGP